MARLPYLDREDLAPADQDLLKRGINLHRQLVHSPGMARAFSAMGQYIRFGSPNTVQLGGFPDRRTARHKRLIRCRWYT